MTKTLIKEVSGPMSLSNIFVYYSKVWMLLLTTIINLKVFKMLQKLTWKLKCTILLGVIISQWISVQV